MMKYQHLSFNLSIEIKNQAEFFLKFGKTLLITFHIFFFKVRGSSYLRFCDLS